MYGAHVNDWRKSCCVPKAALTFLWWDELSLFMLSSKIFDLVSSSARSLISRSSKFQPETKFLWQSRHYELLHMLLPYAAPMSPNSVWNWIIKKTEAIVAAQMKFHVTLVSALESYTKIVFHSVSNQLISYSGLESWEALKTRKWFASICGWGMDFCSILYNGMKATHICGALGLFLLTSLVSIPFFSRSYLNTKIR